MEDDEKPKPLGQVIPIDGECGPWPQLGHVSR